MSEPVSIDQVMAHLRLDPNEAGEDTDLVGAIVAARRRCELHLNVSVGTLAADDVAIVARAILLLVGHWYANREATIVAATVTELPLGVKWLLEPLVVLR